MTPFLYFIEGEHACTDENFRAWKIDYALSAESTSFTLLKDRTPSGRDGTLFFCEEGLKPRSGLYQRQAQRWIKAPPVEGQPRVWVGRYTAQEIKPKDLQRPVLLDGFYVELADGNGWAIPVIRQHISGSNGEMKHGTLLPQWYDLDDDGNFVPAGVLKKHAYLQKVVMPFFDAWYQSVLDALESKKDNKFFETYEPPLDECVVILQANYHIGKAECAHLALLTTYGDAEKIMAVACDLSAATTEATEKKMADLEVSQSGDGEKDSCPATPQPSAN